MTYTTRRAFEFLSLAATAAVLIGHGFGGAPPPCLTQSSESKTYNVGCNERVGSRWFDVSAEWRFPRMLGTARTWNERSLFVTVALRNWWHTFQDRPYRHPGGGDGDDVL